MLHTADLLALPHELPGPGLPCLSDPPCLEHLRFCPSRADTTGSGHYGQAVRSTEQLESHDGQAGPRFGGS